MPRMARKLADSLLQRSVRRVLQDLKNHQTRKGPSQKELAEKTGTTQSHVSEVLNGRHLPSWPMLERVAHALGYEVRVTLERIEEED